MDGWNNAVGWECTVVMDVERRRPMLLRLMFFIVAVDVVNCYVITCYTSCASIVAYGSSRESCSQSGKFNVLSCVGCCSK